MEGYEQQAAQPGSYPADYYKLLSLGSVDHEWASQLAQAAADRDEKALQEIIEQRGFNYRPEMGEALFDLDWARIRAVAEAFGEIHPQLIC